MNRFFSFAVIAIAIFSMSTIQTAQAIQIEMDLEDGVLTIITDGSADYIRISEDDDGEEILVHVHQFDASTLGEGTDPHSFVNEILDNGDHDDVEDFAVESDDEDFDIEDVIHIVVETRGGADCVSAYLPNYYGTCDIDLGEGDDFSLPYIRNTILRGGSGDDVLMGRTAGHGGYGIRIYGDDGDDYISGSGLADQLYGGDGCDEIIGYGGDDFLVGGYDGCVDEMQGNSGADTFRSKYVTRPAAPRVNRNTRRVLGVNLTPAETTVLEEDLVSDFNAVDGDVIQSTTYKSTAYRP